jgi:hypothetical protein
VVHHDGINLGRDQGGDTRCLDRKVADLERKYASMAWEMERKKKGKAVVVEMLLMGAGTPFTRRVAKYRLLEKFKVPQIESYVGSGTLLSTFQGPS